MGLKQSQTSTTIGRINFLLGKEGDVTIRRVNDAKWLAARFKMGVLKGDQIKTVAESRCEVKLNDGSIIRIGENSVFDFAESNLTKNTRQVEASLKIGKIWANVTRAIGAINKFEVKSPTAVCAIRGTIYRMEADSTTRVAVYDGKVDVGPTNDLRQQLQQQTRPGAPVQVPGPTQVPGPFQVSLEQWVQLVQGYQLEVRSNGRYARTPIDSVSESRSDWIQWNKERDRMLR
ncbi:MAG: FecR family protein [candidate division KSB1 bacterium]|nr:FecR family protein [candidate division KSB1 bacterium]